MRYDFNSSPHGSHMKIIGLVGENKTVLDVGCATGQIGERLKKKGCVLVGIEIDKECAKTAKRAYDDVIIADVQKLDAISYPEHFFDVMIFADILEHLKNPDAILIKFKKYLKHDGAIIVSLPNIVRIEIRLKLLLGKFDYEEIGILDRTHLRFFTLKTAKHLLEKNGYKIISVDYSGLASKYVFLKLIPTLFAYQFIIKAVPT